MSEYKGYTQQQNKATQKYLAENMERLQIWVKKGMKNVIKAKADSKGMSMAAYILWLIENDNSSEN